VSQASYHVQIRFVRRYGDCSCIMGGVNMQVDIFDLVSLRNAICVPIGLHVSCYLISVTKLWDMIICLCMWKGWMGNGNVLESKSHWLTANQHHIVLPVTVKPENYNYIWHETHEQILSQWCHTGHRLRGQSTMRTGMNEDQHGALVHSCNRITLSIDIVHMVVNLKIAYGRSWKSWRMS